MATQPREYAALGWQFLTTVVAARDTDVDPGIADMSMMRQSGSTWDGHPNPLRVANGSRADWPPFKIAYVWVCRINDEEIVQIGAPLDGRGFLQQRDSCCDSEPLANPTGRQLVPMTSNKSDTSDAASNELYGKIEEELREAIYNGGK